MKQNNMRYQRQKPSAVRRLAALLALVLMSAAAAVAQQSVAPVIGQLNALAQEVAAIKRCQPATITLPDNSKTVVPTIWASAVADNIVDRINAALTPTTPAT